MKQLKLVAALLFFIITGLFIACNRQEHTTGKNTVAELAKRDVYGEVGYMSANGHFIKLSEEQLSDLFNDLLSFEGHVDLQGSSLHSQQPGTNEQPSVYITMQNSKGTIHVAAVLKDIGNARYLFTGEKAGSCRTVDATAGKGCDIALNGNHFYCTNCDGACKKTTVVRGGAGYPQSFFAAK